MPAEVHEVEWRPPHDCQACRLGSLTVTCGSEDVRRLPVSFFEPSEGMSQVAAEPPVRLHRTHVVQGLGPIPCPIMLIGEAPGFYEDREGEPFIATVPAGRVLAECMNETGLVRYQGVATPWYSYVYMTNALKCRPENNKIDRFPDCLEICRSTFLDQEIAQVQPKVIVCLGKVAALPWFGSQGSLAFRQLPGRLVIHAPHPRYIARGAKDARLLLVEALRVAREVGYGKFVP